MDHNSLSRIHTDDTVREYGKEPDATAAGAAADGGREGDPAK